MHVVDIIIAKRDRQELSDEQIRWVVPAFTKGEIADEQMAALLMAIFLNGMNPRELATWTEAMINTGTPIDLSGLSRPTVDKHSTGGVGDKISLVLCPLVAACGAAVPQVGGRGLGYFGGTLDKMETIAGWDLNLTHEQVVAQLSSVGAMIAGAGPDLAPADRRIYAMRDVIGCVESIPLITSSIMSKKLSEGTQSLVLDVKVGSGAFMHTMERASELAETMVSVGTRNGVKTVALLTEMDTPLGNTAGNAIEVQEALETLAGGGPADFRELNLIFAREMLALAGLDPNDPAHNPEMALADGRAMAVWREMVRAQGGDPDAPLPVAKHTRQVTATTSGYVTRLDAYPVGVAAWRLGAGRARKEDPILPGAGVRWFAKEGDLVTEGDLLFELYTDEPNRFEGALELLATAYEFGAEPPQSRPLVRRRITASDL